MLSEIQRYNDNLSPSSVTPARGDRTGALVTTQGHALYSEMVYQGNVWILNTPSTGVTMNASNVFDASISKPILGIWNPPQSKRIAVVSRVITIWSNGTAPAGGLVWAFVPPMCNVTANTINTEINAASLQIGSSPFQTFVNTNMDGMGRAQILRFLGGPSAGSVGINANHTYVEECNGDIFCPPGAAIGLFPITSTLNPIIFASIVFEAMPQ